MSLFVISFVAGILTILSPCVIPLIPVIIGGSLDQNHKKNAFVITGSLAASIIIFTLLLKASTLFINIHPDFWTAFSGGLLIVLGFITIYPTAWDKFQTKLGISNKSDELLFKSSQYSGNWKPILMGMALGPVFSSCSPTYALILATVLPQSFAKGFIYLIIYALGVAFALLTIAIGGQKVTKNLKWAVDPNGIFKKTLGVIFVVVGLAIVTGVEKDIETYFVKQGVLDVTKIEERILEQTMPNVSKTEMQSAINKYTLQGKTNSGVELNVVPPQPAPEIQGIAHWINTEPLTLSQLKGKVVIIDFWTYSCINCIRTLPFLNSWHEKYADKGLVIIGVHAPEFAFEKVQRNVESAVLDYEIKYPVAMDNDFKTWRAYNNRYWPAKYFIDKSGNVRHYHFGEGEYAESEKVIQYLLAENSEELNFENIEIQDGQPPISSAQTPETYLGYSRAEKFSNLPDVVQNQSAQYTLDTNLNSNEWSIGGIWQVAEKDLMSKADENILTLKFNAKEVYLVMSPTDPNTPKNVKVDINLNGAPLQNVEGEDVNTEGYIIVDTPRLYKVVQSQDFLNNAILELVIPVGVTLNAFTFGS